MVRIPPLPAGTYVFYCDKSFLGSSHRYDYYVDHTDPEERRKIAGAMAELSPWMDGLAASTKGVTFLQQVFSQGCSRKENFLYRPGPFPDREGG